MGRAARHVDGAAVLYGNRVTNAMRECLDVSSDRRRRQEEHNALHGAALVPWLMGYHMLTPSDSPRTALLDSC